ncbi:MULTISPECIES: MFS transporter [unclassified Microbacterium]|uniref:MFS transporter n=1 Tax=unclassified Microbacterium TaxID=2609290 RepID=UPI0009F8CBF9|nr:MULTISPECIES: MFS transporter [unclassified Microbacterium]MDI9890905.1 MFS transporter [Microbacterium sp. IEGM 1404]MXS74345.1 MFS transporter [Microbacterium sp. TL13]
MTDTKTSAATTTGTASWLPLIVVVLTQVQASFAVNALTVSMAGITTDLNTPATSVGTAITAGTFAMAAFILLGAKIGARFGTRGVFQIAVAIHAAAMAGVALSLSPAMLFIAQASSGAVIALIAPALTVFIATNYSGDRQAKAIGLLAAAIPLAGILALLLAGWFAETIGWRYSFALMVALGVVNLVLSFRLKRVPAQRDLRIDWTGALLAAVSIILLSFGFSGLNSWGLWLATAQAPFDVLGVSPAPLLIILGLIGGQLFFLWVGKRQREGAPRIFDLRVLASGTELAITACMSIMLFVGTAANFLIPLYMQVVQGLTGIQTSFSIIPYTISIFLASTFVAYLYKVAPPRIIGSVGFVVVAAALSLIAFTIRGDWGQAFIVVGLVLLGLGQGAIVALVFNTLLSSAPKQLAGDVGAWRGLVHNLSGSVGIAVASAFAVGILAATLQASAEAHPEISPQLISEVNINEADFLTNAQLEAVLRTTSASEAETAAAIQVNEEGRVLALKVSLLALAGLALLAIIPATRMPGRIAGELPEKVEPDDPDAIDASIPLNPVAQKEASS